MPGHIRIPGIPDNLQEKVISFLKEIKGVSNIKSPSWVEFVYNENKFIVGRFYDGEFIVFRKAKSGGMLTNNMRSKSFKDFKERLPKFISLNFRKRTLPHIFRKNDKIEATASTESKQFSYNGQVITASSKEEAIKKIVAGKEIKDDVLKKLASCFTNKIEGIDFYKEGNTNFLTFRSPVYRMFSNSCYSFYIFFEISRTSEDTNVLLRYRVEDYDEQLNKDFKWEIDDLKEAKTKIKSILSDWSSFSKTLSDCSKGFKEFYKE